MKFPVLFVRTFAEGTDTLSLRDQKELECAISEAEAGDLVQAYMIYECVTNKVRVVSFEDQKAHEK